MSAALTAPPAKKRRLHTIVQAPVTMLRSDPGALDGLDVLADVERVLGLPDDDSLALFLWLAVRRVSTWAAVPVEERGRLHGDGRTISQHAAEARQSTPELASALETLPALWSRPEGVEPARVADACDQVGRWAAEAGVMRTAGMFMEAAAAAEPENALRAMDAGLMCQRLGGTEMMQRAEQWHQRAFGLAKVAKRSRKLLSIRALLAYGNWALEAGHYLLARKCYERAARLARRYKRWTYYAIAHHNLLSLIVRTNGDFSVGEFHAQTALEHYPHGHTRIPVLKHDYAVLLNRHRLYHPAFYLLENLPLLIEQPEIRLIAYSSLALAAAGVGKRETFEQAVHAALPLCPLYEDFAANALVRIAEAALILGLVRRACVFGERALQLASDRADTDAAGAAKQVIEMCQSGPARHDNSNTVPPPGIHPAPEFIAVLLQRQLPATVEMPKDAPETPATHDRTRPLPPVPQWPLWGGADTLAGLAALHDEECRTELPPDQSLSVVLWTALRNVNTWAGATPEQRAELFSQARSSDREHVLFFRSQISELRDAFGIFAALHQGPELIGCAQVADACSQVGEWAARGGRMRTAVLFMEAAAAAERESALRAMDAGLMCQRLGGTEMMKRAEEWHQLAFGLALVAPKSRRLLTIRALLAYGNWARDAGDYGLARKCYEAAARRAWRYGKWTYYAMAHHNLLGLIVISDGDLNTAEFHARMALNYYPKGHARVPMLVHDYAVLLNRHHLYTPAFPLLENLAPLVELPEIRLSAHSSLALAAAGIGRRDTFEQAVRAALPLCPLYGDFAAYAFVRMAEGALLFHDYNRAAEYADAARERATQRGDTEVVAAASRLLQRIAAKEPAVREADVPAHSRVNQLQRALRSRLGQFSAKCQGTS